MRRILFFGIVWSVLAPCAAFAQVAAVVFTSDPQTVAPNAISQQISVQTQDGAGTSAPVPSTACVSITSSSVQGHFSSSATTWSPVSVLTMSKNTANKNFYYQDAQEGNATVTARIALKPDTVSSSCANWPIDQWSVGWSVSQQISIGSTASGTNDTSATSGVASDTSATSTAGSSQARTNAQATVSSYVAPPVPTIYTDAGPDRTVIVGADTEFDARAYDKTSELVDHVRFSWNFGDGSTAEGQSVLHHYSYPGRYALVVNIAENKSAAMDEAVIVAEPAKLAFDALPDGGVKITDLAERDLDLSGWIVRAGGSAFDQSFMLPPHSIVLAGSSMFAARGTLGFAATAQAVLQYPNGVTAVAAGQASAGAAASPASSSAIALAVPLPVASTMRKPVAANARPKPVARAPDLSPEPAREPVDQIATSTQVAAAAAAGGTHGSWLWWGAAAALAIAAAGALIAARRLGATEWAVVDASEE